MRRDLKHEMFGRDSKGIPEQQTRTNTHTPEEGLLHLHTAVATLCQLIARHIITTSRTGVIWWQTPTASHCSCNIYLCRLEHDKMALKQTIN